MSGKPVSSVRKVGLLIVALIVVALCAGLALIGIHGNPAFWGQAGSSASSESGTQQPADVAPSSEQVDTTGLERFDLAAVPAYAGNPYVELNGNVPYFDVGNTSSESAETYSPLDELGRCQTAVALVSEDIMPTEERGSISNVHPSGWQTTQYEWIEGKLLFNRCHLIAFQLSGENDNERNLITGTRYLNATGMLPFENEVASYVHRTKNHVYYRVTPVFEGDNLVASGVIMEAESFEDAGAGVRFCVWCYNVEPGVCIDYATGRSRSEEAAAEQDDASEQDDAAVDEAAGGGATAPAGEAAGSAAAGGAAGAASGGGQVSEQAAGGEGRGQANAQTYVLNTNTMRFHYPECPSVADMQEHNREERTATRDELIEEGFRPCGRCTP